MKTPKLLGFCLIAQMLLPLTAEALEGGSHGGGGVGVRCLSPSGKTESFQMLDLYEAQLRGLTLKTSPSTEEDAVNMVAELAVTYSYFPNSVDSVADMKKWTASSARDQFDGKPQYDGKRLIQRTVFGGSLRLSNDFGPYSIAPNCHLEQVAFFTDKDLTMHISKTKWHELNWLNRMALMAHEGVYFLFRERAVENLGLSNEVFTSNLTRRFVGEFLSNPGVVSKSNSIPHSFMDCTGSDKSVTATDMYAFESGDGFTAVFETLWAKLSPYQMKVHFNGLKLADLADLQGQIHEARAPLEFVGETNPPAFTMTVSKLKGEAARLNVFRELSAGVTEVVPTQVLNCTFYK